jgi:subtilisin family serine protease
MRRPVAGALAVGLCLLVAAPPAAAATSAPVVTGTIQPTLQRELAAASSDSLVKAVVVLRSQTDLSGIKAGSRAQRVSKTVTALRSHAASTQKPIVSLLATRRAQGLVTRVVPMWVANDVAVTATPDVITELAARSDVRAVLADATVLAPATRTTAMGPAVPVEPNVDLVNAPALWADGFRGQGVVVANMDSGVDATHPDLASKWRGGTNSWYDPNGQHPTTPTDISGHGTQTMGVMVGGDGGGSSVGIAPDAKWIAAKVFDDSGKATVSGIHLAFQWLLDPDGDPSTADAPNVVNASWTLTSPGCDTTFQPDLASLRSAGILPVFAAGNFGPTAGTLFSPANLPEAFAVGATDDTDALYAYSSRGPSACSGAVAPRLSAPGVDIRTTDLFGGYVTDTGTSVAAPLVAGSLALLLSARPGLTADQQEAALQDGAVDLGPIGPDADFGYGRLDVQAAYATLGPAAEFAVGVAPATAHALAGADATYDVTVTGSGGFGGDVDLSLSGLDPSVASGSFSPVTVTGGSGTATLTVTAASGAAPGSYGFTVTGAGGGTSHDATGTLVVDPSPDFAVTATPATQTVAPGSSPAFTATVTGVNAFAGDVALSVTGLPATVGSVAVSPATVTGGSGSAQLTVSTLPTAPPGSYPLSVDADSGSLHHSTPVTLVVRSAKDFAVVVVPASVTVRRWGTASYGVLLTATGGYVGRVHVSVSGLPVGATARFGTAYPLAPGHTLLRVRTTGYTPRGTYQLVVTAFRGGVSRQTAVTLVVR